jgi:2-polyprenyl-6-methoxyphenol hydroxylase-like FAD-dependent oxidoreductase
LAFDRAGWETVLLERSRASLGSRGFGVWMPPELREVLVEAGYVYRAMPVWTATSRAWIVRDEDENRSPTSTGRVLWRQPFSGIAVNWGLLWAGLRNRIPDAEYRSGVVVDDIRGRTVVTADGMTCDADLVVGADGYRSMVRASVDPAAQLRPAGYLLLRGAFPISRLPDQGATLLEAGFVTVCFPRGQAIFYPIPGFVSGQLWVNWAVYVVAPQVAAISTVDGASRGRLLRLLDNVAAADLPGYWAGIVRGQDRHEIYIQPILDSKVTRYVSRDAALVGDAATVVRPHTGGGACKALEDAYAFELLLSKEDGIEEILADYDLARRPVGNSLVDLGRHIGRAQVEQPPLWATMTPSDFQTWSEGQQTIYTKPEA